MPLITNATGTPDNIDGSNTSFNEPNFSFVYQGSPVLGNNPRVYDVTANSTGVTLNGQSTDDDGGVLIDTGASLTINRDTIVTNRIASNNSNDSDHVILTATDSNIYLTGSNWDFVRQTSNYPSNFLSNANQHLTGRMELTRTNVFGTYAAPNAGSTQGGRYVG